jgi:rhomboid family GlyGly-CTERM serine protease
VTLLGLAVLASNAPLLLAGQPSLALVYAPQAVSSGEWWRLLTHPFVHVSRYHLLLDGVAFLSLLAGLGDLRAPRRLALVGASAAASLAAASLLSGETARYGLCGLSGVGHGLLAATAVLLVRDPDAKARRLGTVVLVLVVAKSLGEALTGRLLLDLVHLGDLGRPNPLCHLGGVVGGGLAATLVAAPSSPRPALGPDRDGGAS